MSALDTFAMRLMRQKLEVWMEANKEAVAAGGSRIQGDLNATVMLYSENIGYIRALKDVSERLCDEVENELRANQ